MKLFRGASAVELMVVRVEPGEDLAPTLQQALGEMELAAAVVVSASGTLERFHLESVAAMTYPPAIYPVDKNGPATIAAAQGIVTAGKMELLLTLVRRDDLYAGIAGPGCPVLHSAEIVLLRAGNTRWNYTAHPTTGMPLFEAVTSAAGAPAAPAVPPQVILVGRPVDLAATALVPADLIRQHGALPVARTGDTIVVAMADPANPFAIDAIRDITKLRVHPVPVPGRELAIAIQQALAALSGSGR
jgi:predicted DNA-binding protein with PD1-like motif